MAISQLSVPFSWGGKGQPQVGVTGGAQVPWVGTRSMPWTKDQDQGMPLVSQTPHDSGQVFEVARNEERSQDKPCACIATERICVALPWEVMPYVFIYTQPNRTEQTLLKVLTDICLWDKGEHDNGVNSSGSQEGKEGST